MSSASGKGSSDAKETEETRRPFASVVIGPYGVENGVNYTCSVCARKWHFARDGDGDAQRVLWEHLPGDVREETSACGRVCSMLAMHQGSAHLRYSS